MITAEQFVEKHARRLKGATEDIRQGVENVTENPAKLAADSADKWQIKLSSEETKNRFKAGLGRVSLDDWKRSMIDKGLGRIAAGVDGAADKVRDFAGKLLPHVESGLSKIKGMPDLTLDDSINRMVEFTRHMSKLKTK